MISPQDKGRKYEKILDEGEIAIPLSGAGRQKEDSKTPTLLKQKKHTTAKSYSLKLEDLRKLEKEAAQVSREPVFQLAFESEGRIYEYVLQPKRIFDRKEIGLS